LRSWVQSARAATTLRQRYHNVVSHDNGSFDFACFEMALQSFDPIIDRGRDVSHPRLRNFCPNPRIRMQNWPKSQSRISWDRSAKLADSVTLGNDWLSFSLHHTPSSNVPGFYENPPRVLDWPSFNGSPGIAPYATARSSHPVKIVTTTTVPVRMAGSVSCGLELDRGKMFPMSSSRANSAYNRFVPFLT
jgi:hypothetical protein